MKKKSLFWLVFWFILSIAIGSVQAAQLSATELSNKIIQTADENSSPRESLVQWYYTVDDLYTRTKKVDAAHPQLARLEIVKTNLRNELTKRKTSLTKTNISNFYEKYKSYITWSALSNSCKNQVTIADDWGYALDLPTALILATWDIESSCGRYKPSNGDGIFQIVAKDYGSDDNFTLGQWIIQMYDYAELIRGKHARYHNSNNLLLSWCSNKNLTATGQTAPVCLSYTTMDMDSLIKYGALYNGLSGAVIKGDIQPAASAYVYGKFGSENQSANKDGILMRVLKVLDYMN